MHARPLKLFNLIAFLRLHKTTVHSLLNFSFWNENWIQEETIFSMSHYKGQKVVFSMLFLNYMSLKIFQSVEKVRLSSLGAVSQ